MTATGQWTDRRLLLFTEYEDTRRWLERRLLEALHEIDRVNRYFVYVNRETDPELVPRGPEFRLVRCAVAARFRPV